MQTDTIRTSFMLPAELHDRLAAQAREQERSLGAELRIAVREHLRGEPESRDHANPDGGKQHDL